MGAVSKPLVEEARAVFRGLGYELTAEGEAALAAAAASLDGDAAAVTTAMRQGSPAEEILSYADERGSALIVMGTRQAAYTQNMLGSVSHEVVVRATAPVLTVNLVEQ